MMDAIFSSLNFIASGFGILFVAALAAGIVLVWDWRIALAGLFLVQMFLAVLMVRVHGIPVQWAIVQTLVIGLCCIMLALSAIQVHLGRGGRQNGNWFFRGLCLVLLAFAWQILDVRLPLPLISPQVSQLFGWLILMALLIFSLGDSPLFSAAALLLWCSISQALITVFAPIPELIAGIGLVEIVLGLSCSYLILAEQLPRAKAKPILTDVVFPISEETIRPTAPALLANGRSGGERPTSPVVRTLPPSAPTGPEAADFPRQGGMQ